jgi:hypothetical protein
MQAAADSAALAAASDIYENWNLDFGIPSDDTVKLARKSAGSIAKDNGFADGKEDTTVTISIPPGSKANKLFRRDGYVEVSIERTPQKYFSKIFDAFSGKEMNPVTISARAVARGWIQDLPTDIIALHPTAAQALLLQGSGDLQVARGTIYVNSNNSDALHLDAGAVNSLGVKVVGGVSPGSGVFKNFKTGLAQAPEKVEDPMPDPFSYIPEPARPPERGSVDAKPGNQFEVQPGWFKGEAGQKLDFKSGDKVTFQKSGVYYLESGGFTSEGATIDLAPGARVLLFNAGTNLGPPAQPGGDKIWIVGGDALGDSVTLRSPTSGPYQGMTIFQARTSTLPIKIISRGVFDIQGTIYAAGGSIDISGEADGAITGSQLIAATIRINRLKETKVNSYTGRNAKVRDIRLVE